MWVDEDSTVLIYLRKRFFKRNRNIIFPVVAGEETSSWILKMNICLCILSF